MSNALYVQYVGFVAGTDTREYTFSVKNGSDKAREFQLTIPNEAFLSNRVRFQDAPDICSQRLRCELATSANQPVETRFTITDAEIDQYRVAHTPKPQPAWQKSRPEDE